MSVEVARPRQAPECVFITSPSSRSKIQLVIPADVLEQTAAAVAALTRETQANLKMYKDVQKEANKNRESLPPYVPGFIHAYIAANDVVSAMSSSRPVA